MLTTREKVEIPTEYKGFVIGKYEANLLRISKETGTEVIRERGEVYIIRGNKQQRDQAKLLIKRRVVGSLDKFCLPSINKSSVTQGRKTVSLLLSFNQFCLLLTLTSGELMFFS